MNVVASLAGAEHGATITFEIDWETGAISDPFVRHEHERNGAPERVWYGRASYFVLRPDVLTEPDWQQLKEEIGPLIDEVREGYSTKVDPGSLCERGVFTEAAQDARVEIDLLLEDFPFDWDAAIYSDPGLYFLPQGRGDGPVEIDTSEGPRTVASATSDDELERIAKILAGDVDDGVIVDGDIGTWLHELRAELRDEDDQWGTLRPALEALIAAGDPRVRYKSQHEKYNPDGLKIILIANRPSPQMSDFEPACLSVGETSLRQWHACGLDYPAEFRGRAELALVRSTGQHVSARVAEALGESAAAKDERTIRAEIARLEDHLQRLKLKLDGLASDLATAHRNTAWIASQHWSVLTGGADGLLTTPGARQEVAGLALHYALRAADAAGLLKGEVAEVSKRHTRHGPHSSTPADELRLIASTLCSAFEGAAPGSTEGYLLEAAQWCLAELDGEASQPSTT